MSNASNFITVLDPSLQDHQGNNSNNLGDLIIFDSISKHLTEMFPNKEIVRISTHSFLEQKHYSILKEDNLKFFGGTNALSSNIRKYHQWKLDERKYFFVNPQVKNIILFGLGWWQYQEKPTVATRHFYKRVLSKSFSHSVRDAYTRDKLIGMGMKNTLNTSCPTTWELNGLNVNRKNLNSKNCLFTLTDYNKDPVLDTQLIKILFEYYSGEIYFFPQGTRDEEYINKLSIFKSNKDKIKILHRSVNAFQDCITNNDINFIGTRLHGGIRCLQKNIDSMIIAVDNRAQEIGKDINLPVMKRADFGLLKKWLNGESVFSNIALPANEIETWKSQFRGR